MKPGIASIVALNSNTIRINVTQGTNPLQSIDVKVDGVAAGSGAVAGSFYDVTYELKNTPSAVTVTLQDNALYTVAGSENVKKP